VQEPGSVLAECLADLDRNRKALRGPGQQFSNVFNLIDTLLRRGEIAAARAMSEDNRKAVMSLCELASSSAEQQIVLALKLAEVTYSRHTGGDSPALREMERTVSAFVSSALGYLEVERKHSSPAIGPCLQATHTDSQSKEQML
jgi:hypothetical protein